MALTKKENKQQVQLDPVFTYLVSQIGESRDIYRFNIEQNDLEDAVSLFNVFKGNKEYLIKNNSDKRCKIQSIDKFTSDEHWSIDRWWSKEEKIDLGILEEDNKVTIEEFVNKIDEIRDTLKEYSQLIKELSND